MHGDSRVGAGAAAPRVLEETGDQIPAEPRVSAARVHHGGAKERRISIDLEAYRRNDPVAVLRHKEIGQGGLQPGRREIGGSQQAHDLVVVRGRRPQRGAHGLRARTKAPMTQPPISRANTSESKPASLRNARASANS
jgi:hypothetical protein